MRRLEVPFSGRRELLRRTLIVAWVLGWVLVGFALYFGIRYTLRSSGLSGPVAVYATASYTVFAIFSTYITQWGGYRVRVGWHLLVGLLFGSAVGALLLGAALVSWHLSAGAAAVLAIGGTVLTTPYFVRSTRHSSYRSLAGLARGQISRQSAMETYEASRRAMEFDGISPEQKKTAMLNLVQACIAMSISGEAPAGLVEAADVLRELLADPPRDWFSTMSAAMILADASYYKADMLGDFSGYRDALELLADIASRMPPDFGAAAIVQQKRAEHQFELAYRLPPGPERNAQFAGAIALWRAAIDAVVPPVRRLLPVLHADLGSALAFRADPGDLDAGIAECQVAVRLARLSPRNRGYAQLALGGLLHDRAMEAATRAPPGASELEPLDDAISANLARAERLLRRASRNAAPSHRGRAAAMLADTYMMRARMTDSASVGRRGIRTWRRAAKAAVHDSPTQQIRIGAGWAAWAADAREPSWCAEAYWYLMSAVPRAIAVRYFAEERDRVLAVVQSTAEEAGYWLAEAGQAFDAAIAVETGRAVSLSEVLSRERLDLESTLRAAGHADLAERYRVAVNEYGAATAPAHRERLDDTAQRAWARYSIIVREIAAVTDIDPPGTPPSPEDLTAAAREGPVIYLAAARLAGYAIIVSAVGAPAYLPLPLLTRDEVTDIRTSFAHATDLLASAGTPSEMTRAAEEIATTLRRLWDAGIAELASELPAGALVTIVPVGMLSLLPVHAAGGPATPGQPPEDWTYLCDRVTIRYAPNARMLLHTGDRVSKLPPETLSLLAIAAPDALPSRKLRFAVREIKRISRLWGQRGGLHAVTDGAYGAVERQLAHHTVWHFACHGVIQPDRILDSALILTGAPLSLRTILTLPPAPRRLAALSACETHQSDLLLPDEAMGLPAGLLLAGFAGVIASHWAVNDRSTACLMARFYELWLIDGLPPAFALAQAQRWLRAATYVELLRYLHDDQPAGRPVTAAGGIPLGQSQERGFFRHPLNWAAFALTGQ